MEELTPERHALAFNKWLQFGAVMVSIEETVRFYLYGELTDALSWFSRTTVLQSARYNVTCWLMLFLQGIVLPVLFKVPIVYCSLAT